MAPTGCSHGVGSDPDWPGHQCSYAAISQEPNRPRGASVSALTLSVSAVLKFTQVNSIIRFKRCVLQEVPLLEQRGRAAAGLAVVQDYLLASVGHLQHLAGQQQADAASIAAAAAPSWSGTAQVQRPSASWDQ